MQYAMNFLRYILNRNCAKGEKKNKPMNRHFHPLLKKKLKISLDFFPLSSGKSTYMTNIIN